MRQSPNASTTAMATSAITPITNDTTNMSTAPTTTAGSSAANTHRETALCRLAAASAGKISLAPSPGSTTRGARGSGANATARGADRCVPRWPPLPLRLDCPLPFRLAWPPPRDRLDWFPPPRDDGPLPFLPPSPAAPPPEAPPPPPPGFPPPRLRFRFLLRFRFRFAPPPPPGFPPAPLPVDDPDSARSSTI